MSRPTILVVDDDRKTVELIKLYLESAGFGVVLAYDGQSALDLASSRAFDLVILDLMLPLGSARILRGAWPLCRAPLASARFRQALTLARGVYDRTLQR